jgi:hypothetical protein
VTATFEPGEIVYMRHFQRDKVAGIFPCRAVDHDDEGLLLWAEQGAPAWHIDPAAWIWELPRAC